MKSLLIALIIFITATACSAMPLKVKDTLMWDTVTTNTDGSLVDDLMGYRVYWRLPSGQYEDFFSTKVGNVTTVSIREVAGSLKGSYCFVVTAMNNSNTESDFSNEICADFIIKMNIPSNMRMP